MMGHETMQMIYEKYYSYIKNYERNEGSAFMERVFNLVADGSGEAEDQACI